MIKVSEIMSRKFHTITPDSTVKAAAAKMAELNIGIMVVTNPEKTHILGIFSERDVLKKIAAKGLPSEHAKVQGVMTDKVITINENTDILDAWKIMKEKHFRHLPIINSQQTPVGLLSARDILDFLANNGQLISLLSRR